MEWLEAGTYDVRVRLAAKDRPDSDKVIIVDVDNQSFDALKSKLGRWPWERRVWTAVLQFVQEGKPKAVLYDIIFEGESSDPAVDDHLAEEARTSGDVVLAYAFTGGEGDPKDWAALEGEKIPTALPGKDYGRSHFSASVPIPKLAKAAAGLGNIMAQPDPDGVIRRTPLVFRSAGNGYPSLALRGVQVALGIPPEPASNSEGVAHVANRLFPIDRNGNMVLHWHLRYDNELKRYEPAIRRVPILQLICSKYPQQCPDYTSKITPDTFAGKVVVVGASAAGAQDLKPMPFGDVVPGFLAHATAVENLLEGTSIAISPFWLSWSLVLAFALIGAAIAFFVTSTWRDVLLLLVIAGGYFGVCYLALSRAALWLPVVAPCSAMVFSYFSSAAIRFTTTGRELRRTRHTLNRYMAPQLVDYVLSHPEELNLAGERKDLTIFFSDVRNFTTLTEGSDPQALVKQLNEYLAAMTESIFDHEGIVDKFIGDGILAHWGAFSITKNHAVQAAEASLEMLQKLRELNAKWKQEGRPELAIGIGLNTGEVIFGEMGAGKKVEFTVIGDPVNLAARLEGLNKDYKTSIIISQFTLERLGDAAVTRSLGGVKVKGKTIETLIYELQGLKSADAATITAATTGTQ